MNGDFSPSLFINPIESRVHLIVKEYIKCLLEQEALEQAQQEQTTIDTQQKSPTETEPQEQSTPTIEKTHKEQTQAHNSPSSQGRVQQSREVVKENHPQTCHHNPKLHKARRAKAAHLPKGGCRLRLRGLRKTRRAKAPALKFTKKILGEVSRSDGGVKNRSATEGINTHRNKEKICPSVLLSKIKSPQGHSSPLENYQVIFRRTSQSSRVGHNSPPENYQVIFRRSTPKGGGGQKTISKFLRLSVVSA